MERITWVVLGGTDNVYLPSRKQTRPRAHTIWRHEKYHEKKGISPDAVYVGRIRFFNRTMRFFQRVL